MTAPERLAKVAEVLWVAQAVYDGNDGNTREWAEMAWADMGGSEPSEERAEHEIVVSAAAPLLDEFQAEDEAQGAARVREAVEALASEWEATARESRPHLGCLDMHRHLAGELRAALDAAEKAAVEPASVPTSEREGGNGPDHSGKAESPSDRRTATQDRP